MNMTVLDQSPRQRDVWRRIAELEAAGQPITTQRLAHDLNIARQNMRTYLLALRDKGLIHYDAQVRQQAFVRLTTEGRSLLHGGYPVVGTVAAGQPIEIVEPVEHHIIHLEDAPDLREGDFLLRVSGDSMTGAGIFDGDLVAIRPTSAEPAQGAIAVVLLPESNTGTLKRWYRSGNKVSLHSENPLYEPIALKADEIQVQGWLVGRVGKG